MFLFLDDYDHRTDGRKVFGQNSLSFLDHLEAIVENQIQSGRIRV